MRTPLPLLRKKDWFVARAMFTNHFSEHFFVVLLPCWDFWSYMLRLHTGAVCGLWFLVAIGSVGVFGIFTNHAKNMDLLRKWISTEIVTCILHTSKIYSLGSGMSHTPCSQTNMLFPSGQNVGKPFRRWRKSETHSLETMVALPSLDPPETVIPVHDLVPRRGSCKRWKVSLVGTGWKWNKQL